MARHNLLTAEGLDSESVIIPGSYTGFQSNPNKVCRSGASLYYIDDLPDPFADRATDMTFQLLVGFDKPQPSDRFGQVNKAAGFAIGATAIDVDGLTVAPLPGASVKFSGHATKYVLQGGSQTPTLTKFHLPAPGLTSAIVDDENFEFFAGAADFGPAIFDNVTDGSQRGLYLAVYNGQIIPILYKQPLMYIMKYNDGGNYRTNPHWDLHELTEKKAYKIRGRLRDNRYLKMYQDGFLLTFTADSLSAPLTEIDLLNIDDNAGNSYSSPDAGGFWHGWGSGWLDNVQQSERYAYGDKCARIR